jgi:hypothetical protein
MYPAERRGTEWQRRGETEEQMGVRGVVKGGGGSGKSVKNTIASSTTKHVNKHAEAPRGSEAPS